MEYVYAALLLHKLDQEVKEENVKKVMTAAGAKPNDAKIKALISALEDVNIDEALKSAVLTSAAPPAAGAPAGDAAATEAAPDEEKKEKKEEEALEGLSSLFG
ncbi:MAG: 50S ribosomal protein P1 [Thaumarchaeota archaeon]|nr:50S ribosomal protein P1 [Nitrososphaerota archaeon]